MDSRDHSVRRSTGIFMKQSQPFPARIFATGVLAVATLLSGPSAAAPAGASTAKDVVLVPTQGQGMAGDTASTRTDAPARPVAAHIVFSAALNDLGLQLLRSPSMQSGAAGNTLVSPFSVVNALGLLHAGAGGVTASEIAGVVTPAVAGGRRLQAMLGNLNRQSGGITGGAGVEWIAANRVWIDSGVVSTLPPPFIQQAQQIYQADGARIDFSDSARSRATINDWAAQRSQGKIKSLLPERGIAPNTRLVLTNAVYFKGKWATPFNPAQTHAAVFHHADGSQASIPTMAGVMNVREGMFGKWQLIELPYAHADFALVIASPQDGTPLSAVEPELDGADLAEWQSRLSPARIDLRLPRFSVQPHSASLKAAMQQTGMVQAFTSAANFEPMLGKSSVMLDDLYHAAGIDVDEHGSEAVASTAAVSRAKSFSLPEAVPLRKIDRPFLFVLLHKPTHTPLFVGRISQLK